jgi:hypothetical protein
VAVLGRQPVAQVPCRLAVAVILEHAREQLLGRFSGLELETQVVVVGGQHEPRLELQQRGDQHQELGGGLQIELACPFHVLDIGEYDLGEGDLEQVDLLLEDQCQEEVEGTVEDLEVEVERRDIAQGAGRAGCAASRVNHRGTA